jgi:hypothetical protein
MSKTDHRGRQQQLTKAKPTKINRQKHRNPVGMTEAAHAPHTGAQRSTSSQTIPARSHTDSA